MFFNYIIIKINTHVKPIRDKNIFFLSYDSLESETKIYGKEQGCQTRELTRKIV
jgi:hypothetical protein